jgi:hypothetical protein
MKLIFALAAAGFISSLMATTPASAQRDPACMEKCNRDNPRGPGLHQQQRGTAVRMCVQACPKAGAAGAKAK